MKGTKIDNIIQKTTLSMTKYGTISSFFKMIFLVLSHDLSSSQYVSHHFDILVRSNFLALEFPELVF